MLNNEMAGGRCKRTTGQNPDAAENGHQDQYTRWRPGSQAIRERGRVIGELHDLIFYKTLAASRHMLRRPAGWALGCDSLAQAERAGAQHVEILDTDTNRCYRASIQQIRRYGIPMNRGFGPQLALPLGYWTVADADAPLVVQERLL